MGKEPSQKREQKRAAAVVADHYNARPQVPSSERHKSKIIGLKSAHNFVKSALINKYGKAGASVLDFCCGKGGDLNKWQALGASSLVGVDIADVSIQHAISRFNSGNFCFHADFYPLDLFREKLFETTGPREFNLVSCQFALHYSFETEGRARRALENISIGLVKGGHFVCTIPDAHVIHKKLSKLPPGELSFGNSIYNITFEQRDTSPMFGHKYTFALEDAIDSLPEYLISFDKVKSMARDYKLRLVEVKPLLDFYLDSMERDAALRDRFMDKKADPTKDEFEVMTLYLVLAFVKE